MGVATPAGSTAFTRMLWAASSKAAVLENSRTAALLAQYALACALAFKPDADDRLMMLPPLLFLIVFELVADIFAKEWALHGTAVRWLAAIGGFVIANAFWLSALRKGAGLGRGVVIFSVSTAILATLLGIVFYEETLSKIQLLGIAVGIFSLILIFWKG